MLSLLLAMCKEMSQNLLVNKGDTFHTVGNV